MPYEIIQGRTVHTDRALVLRHTVHHNGTPTELTVVMLDVTRVTPERFRLVGRRALDLLAALRPELAAVARDTDAELFGRRYAHPVTGLTLNAAQVRDTLTNTTTYGVDYTHRDGGGTYADTTVVLTSDGRTSLLPTTAPTA